MQSDGSWSDSHVLAGECQPVGAQPDMLAFHRAKLQHASANDLASKMGLGFLIGSLPIALEFCYMDGSL